MPRRSGYPATVAEILDFAMTFRPAALRAVRKFAKEKPWRGELARRVELFRTLNAELAAAYEIAAPILNMDGVGEGDSGASSYCPANHTISLRGRLSVVTFLHEFGHSRGMGERGATKFSVNLFRRCFPRSYAQAVADGHCLRRAPDPPADPESPPSGE